MKDEKKKGALEDESSNSVKESGSVCVRSECEHDVCTIDKARTERCRICHRNMHPE